MTGEFVLRIWSPGAREPAPGGTHFHAELALDRDLLGVADGTISRAANAPKVKPVSSACLELHVPERSARPVIVVEGLRFEALQHGVPPAAEGWKIAPGQLSRPGRLVCGRQVALALVRQIDWDRLGPTHHLLLLPRALRVERGSTVTITTPAIVVVGEAAVDVTSNDTLIPGVTLEDVAHPVSFRLADVEQAIQRGGTLDGYFGLDSALALRAPESEIEHTPASLGAVATELLDATIQSHVFFPVLEDERRARLALGYRRQNGAVGVALSGPDPERFLSEIQTHLGEGGAPNVGSSPPPRRTSVLPPSVPHDVAATFGTIETRNSAFAAVLDQVARVAPSELGVLLLGESGTGKEYLATAMHAASPRHAGPFVALNCSSISDDLIESELFGHKRGAFTGAHSDRIGAFAGAHGGTLLLDEIGDAPLRVQLSLLRALESRRIRPVGSDIERAVDVRVVAATSRDLQQLIESGAFRRDLYYRLAELVVELPPLRERPEDIPGLATTILATLGNATLSKQAEALLSMHTWPGNVRELRNVLKRAIAFSRGADVLQAIHFAPLGREGLAVEIGTMPPPALSIEFPPHVMAHADRIWRTGEVPRDGDAGATKQAQRSLNRAALMCLASRAAIATWPTALSREWYRQFGAKWATSEEGRGLREVVRELGLDGRDERVRDGLRAWVEAEVDLRTQQRG